MWGWWRWRCGSTGCLGLGVIGYVGTAVVAGLLLYEHLLVRPGDLRRMNAAFFLLNGVISVVFFLFTVAGVMVR